MTNRLLLLAALVCGPLLASGVVCAAPTVIRQETWWLVQSTHWPGSGLSHYVNAFEDRESCERSIKTVIINDTAGGENEWLYFARCVPASNRAEAIGRTINGELYE